MDHFLTLVFVPDPDDPDHREAAVAAALTPFDENRWTIGGRWSGYFTPKVPTLAVGHDGRASDVEKVDMLPWREVDLPAMRFEARQEAERAYDRMLTVTTDLFAAELAALAEASGLDPQVTTWGWVDATPDAASWRERDALRWALARTAWRAVVENPIASPWLRAGGRVTYVEDAVADAGVPYAMVVDGQWLASAATGHPGITTTDKAKHAAWRAQVEATFAATAPTTLVAAVDCHI